MLLATLLQLGAYKYFVLNKSSSGEGDPGPGQVPLAIINRMITRNSGPWIMSISGILSRNDEPTPSITGALSLK